jgi:hypothetical protein
VLAALVSAAKKHGDGQAWTDDTTAVVITRPREAGAAGGASKSA